MIVNKKLLNIFKKNLKLNPSEVKNLKDGKIDIKINAHAKWDSLMHVKIISDLEKSFNIDINEKNFLKLVSVFKINKLLNK